jgi:hypothetical protein
MVDPYYASVRNEFLPGYSITSANRIQMLAKMEQYVRMADIKINSRRLTDEFRTFIVTSMNRPEAIRGTSDDLIMALAGALWVREEAFLSTYRSDEMTKALLESMSSSTMKSNQIQGYTYGGGNMYDRARIEEHIADQNKIRMADGSVIDLNWLIGKG